MLPSADPSAMVFLRSANRLACAKQFHRDQATNKILSTDYAREMYWDADVEHLAGLDDLSDALAERSAAGDCIVIVGRCIDDTAPRQHVLRRKEGADAVFQDAERLWLPVDLDGISVPPGLALEERLRIVRSQLPAPFNAAGCVYQLTSSYGIKGRLHDMRMRLWFWLSEPVSNAVMRAYWSGTIADPSIYMAVQPIYIAAPTFGPGVADPVKGARLGRLDGPAVVDVGAMAERLAAAQVRATAAARGAVIQRKDVEPCATQIQARIEAIRQHQTGGARHHHALGVACELYALGAEPEIIAEVCTEVIVSQGREPMAKEIEGLLRRAVAQDNEGRLRSEHTPLSQVLPAEKDAEVLGDAKPMPEPAQVVLTAEEALAECDDEMCAKYPDSVNARIFLLKQHGRADSFIRWNQTDWEWRGRCWRPLLNSEILKSRVMKHAGSTLSVAKVASVTEAVRNLSTVEALALPGWISRQDGEKASPALVVANGMLFINDVLVDAHSALQPHNKDYFNTVALPFDFNPDAKCPTWEQCVHDWFKGDAESKRELQKMFGYLLIPDNAFEKFFILTDTVGRAGKGTAMQVLEWMLGEDALAATTFQGFSKDFGLASLAGKLVVLFNEANAESNKDVPPIAVDRLKAITGNDRIEVEQKYRESVFMRFSSRFVISCNRIPKFRDPSGALLKRMHVLEFKQTFFGRENKDLKSVGGPLYRELSGILNWAIEGLRMLYYEDKAFFRPKIVQDLVEQLERAASPMKVFFRECLVHSPDDQAPVVEKDTLYTVYANWCRLREGIRPLSRERFFAELRCLAPYRVESQPRAVPGQPRARVWSTLALTEDGESLSQGGFTFADTDAASAVET